MSSTAPGGAWDVASRYDVAATSCLTAGSAPGLTPHTKAQRHAIAARSCTHQIPGKVQIDAGQWAVMQGSRPVAKASTRPTPAFAGAPRSYAAALRGTGARTSTDTGQAAEFHPAASAEPPSAATTPGPGPAAVDAAALSPSAPAPASPSAPASPQPACNVAHPAGHVSPRDMTSAPTNFERHPSKTTETQLAREQHQGQEQPQPPQQQQQTPTGRDIPDDGVPADSVEERGAGSRGGIAPEEDMHLLTRALDAGCSLLQSKGPVNKIHQHVCAFHMWVGVGAGGRGWVGWGRGETSSHCEWRGCGRVHCSAVIIARVYCVIPPWGC